MAVMTLVGCSMHLSKAQSGCTAALLLVAVVLSRGAAADPTVPSLRPDVPLSEQLQRQFRVKDGLPSNWIYDVVQTRDGYLWIATHNGLARYDGLRFRVFNRSNTRQLPANDTRALYEDSDGGLWIGTIGGLARYRPGRPGRFEAVESFTGNSVHAIYEDRAGVLWIGTREETWFRANGREFEIADNVPHNVKAICGDQHGALWFGSESGLYMRQDTEIERIAHERLPKPSEGNDGISPAGVNVLLADDRGGVWIGANRGLLYINDGRFELHGSEIGQQQIYDLLETRDGGLYAATRYGLYRSVDGGEFVRLTSEEFTCCIEEDREGGLWVGHFESRGLHHYRNGEARSVLTEHRVNCVHEDPEGNMWFGSCSGLHCLRDGQITHYGIADGLPSVRVQTIAQGSENSFWIGTRKGLARWSGTELSTVDTPSQLAQMNIASAFEDSTGVLWFALESGGGYALRDGELSQLQVLDHGRVSWFYEDSRGSLWIGHEYGLFRRRDDQIRQVTDPAFERLNTSHFTCQYTAKDGTLWMGTSGGIVRYRSRKFDVFTSEDGLAADYVDRMAEDHHGNLWLGGRDGFFHVRMSELDDVAAGRRPNFASYRIEQLDGVPVSTHHPKACLTTDGTMWIVGRRGAIYVPPEPVLPNLVPPTVQIEQVRIDGKTVRADGGFGYLSGRHRLAIDFAAPTFARSQYAQVKYRLDGHDEDWVDAGDERVAYYTGLRPGDYRFRVTAGNGDGVWLEGDHTIGFTVNPRWFETVWFRTTFLLGMIGLVAVSVRQYTRKVRKRNIFLRREINERKQAELKLRRSETQFRDLSESTQAIPWEADAATFQFTFVGQQAVNVLGYPVEDWLEEDFWVEHFHPEDRLEAIEYCRRAAARGENHQAEYRMIAASGAIVWIHDVVHVIMKDGVAEKLSGFMVDVTARRNAEEKARDYLRQLARINRAASMGEMATSIAHEVNQPLFAIVSNAQTAKRLLDREQPDIAEVREALDDIASDGNRAASIIDHVRSRVRKEQHPTEQLDLNQVALETIRFIGPEIRQRGLSLRTDLADNLPSFKGNSIELQQVILNLIINGAHAMRDVASGSHELLLWTSAQNGFVELAVQDHGVGFDEELADRFFEPFFTTKPDGTGMGLAINRTIIEGHGGRIWATSNTDRGATFYFRLPALTEEVG